MTTIAIIGLPEDIESTMLRLLEETGYDVIAVDDVQVAHDLGHEILLADDLLPVEDQVADFVLRACDFDVPSIEVEDESGFGPMFNIGKNKTNKPWDKRF